MINAQITQISEEQFDDLFKDAPSSTPTAEDLVIAKDDNGGIIPQIDDLDEFAKEEEAKNKKEEKKKDTSKKEEKEVVEEEKEEEKEEVKEVSEDVKSALKSTVDHFVETGIWKEFDGRDKMEFDPESYIELAKAQEEQKLEDRFTELLDSTGPYGQAIIEHIKNGGNPEDVIDIFKEQKQIEAIDVSTDEGKMEMVGRYYTEIVGWKPERVKKHIQRLIDAGDDEFQVEATEVKEKYDEHYNKQLAEIKQQADDARVVEKQRQDTFKLNIKKALQEDKDLTEKEKRNLEKSILDFRHKLPTGAVVNDFYVKFAEMQSNPKDYLELVQFVTDKQAYKTKLQTKSDSNAAKNTFKFIKSNSAVSKSKGNEAETEKDKDTKINFKSLLH